MLSVCVVVVWVLGRWWEGGSGTFEGLPYVACILSHSLALLSAPKNMDGLFLWPLFTSLFEPKLSGAYASWHQDWQALLEQHRRGIFDRGR